MRSAPALLSITLGAHALIACADTGAGAGADPTDAAPGLDAPVVDVDVPSDPAALQAWLAAGSYLTLPAESGRHASAGPHPGTVRTFLTPSLMASLAGTGEHPRGAAAIKELYTGDTLRGWAVAIKLEDASRGGAGWYWHEVFSTSPTAAPDYGGVGLTLCTSCHGAGHDYVMTPFPLR